MNLKTLSGAITSTPLSLVPPFKTVLREIKMKVQRQDLLFAFCLCHNTIEVLVFTTTLAGFVFDTLLGLENRTP